MKKILSLLMVFTMVFSLVACSSPKNEGEVELPENVGQEVVDDDCIVHPEDFVQEDEVIDFENIVLSELAEKLDMMVAGKTGDVEVRTVDLEVLGDGAFEKYFKDVELHDGTKVAFNIPVDKNVQYFTALIELPEGVDVYEYTSKLMQNTNLAELWPDYMTSQTLIGSANVSDNLIIVCFGDTNLLDPYTIATFQ